MASRGLLKMLGPLTSIWWFECISHHNGDHFVDRQMGIDFTLHCVAWCYFLVDFLAWRIASSTDGRWQWLCRCAQVDVSLIILEWFKKTDCISSALFVGWKRALPIFTWDVFTEWWLNRVSDRFKKTYFLSLPSSCILLQLLFVMSQALLGGAYRAIISMHC